MDNEMPEVPNIALRAYQLWDAAGRPDGRSEEFYFLAEEEFRKLLETDRPDPPQRPDSDLVDRMAKKHAVSSAAVEVVLTALRRGGGTMAQFSHADFGGMSQWSPGMSMVGDMFNTQLLCSDIAAHLNSSPTAGGMRSAAEEISDRSMSETANWWPAGMGRPGAVGAQNDLRYAVFPDTRRLVIDDQGKITIYDTGDHRIFGVGQAQSSDQTLSFTSQNGLVSVVNLQKVAS
jgi:hypothetical protein